MTTGPADVFHLIQENLWIKCKEDNKAYVPPTYEQDGFIHATEDPSMLIDIGNHFYKLDPSKYILLRIDPALLDVPIKYEAAAPVGDTEAHTAKPEVLFPHIYGPLNIGSVTKEYAVNRLDDGTFVSIDGF